MHKFKSAVCPFCGKKVNPLQSWILKQQGEYVCKKCKGVSNVVLDPTAPFFGVTAIFLSTFIFLIFKFFVGEINFLCIFLMLLPFIIFNILSLFLIRLKRPGVKKVVQTQHQVQNRKNPPHRL